MPPGGGGCIPPGGGGLPPAWGGCIPPGGGGGLAPGGGGLVGSGCWATTKLAVVTTKQAMNTLDSFILKGSLLNNAQRINF